MPKVQSADFEDRDGKRIFSVSGFLRTTQQCLRNLGKAYIQGEVSSISDKYQLFFLVLHDDSGNLNCAVPRGILRHYQPAVGDKLLVYGSNSLNVKSSQYNFWVEQLFKQDGLGLMAEQLRLLKERLVREGVFARSKRPLPQFIDRVGVITSEVGSVIHDIELTIQRRNPLVELYLYPARVQGEGAALQLVQALKTANAHQLCDVLILGRGGGSFEDLLPFYDEALVREVAASRIPIISAVGHETDTPLCDFAADVRAATPTAAAELCTAITHAQLCFNLEEIFSRLEQGMARRLQESQSRLELTLLRLQRSGPAEFIAVREQRLTGLCNLMGESLSRQLAAAKERQSQALQRLLTLDLKARLTQLQAELTLLLQRLKRALERSYSVLKGRFEQDLYAFDHCSLPDRLQSLNTRYLTLVHTLQALDPLKILSRGYSVTLTVKGQLADFDELRSGERLETILASGKVISTVTELIPNS